MLSSRRFVAADDSKFSRWRVPRRRDEGHLNALESAFQSEGSHAAEDLMLDATSQSAATEQEAVHR
jgi:hypothetical protein